MTLALGLLDADMGPVMASGEVLRALQDDLPRGVRIEPLRHIDDFHHLALLLWLEDNIDPGESTTLVEDRLAAQLGLASASKVAWCNFAPRFDSGQAYTTSPLTNLIVRDIESTQLEGFLDTLRVQMGRVGARPGCQGVFLGQQRGRSTALLGITRWASISSLEAYLQWPSAQEFKSVVDPLTRGVPLRFLGVPL